MNILGRDGNISIIRVGTLAAILGVFVAEAINRIFAELIVVPWGIVTPVKRREIFLVTAPGLPIFKADVDETDQDPPLFVLSTSRMLESICLLNKAIVI